MKTLFIKYKILFLVILTIVLTAGITTIVILSIVDNKESDTPRITATNEIDNGVTSEEQNEITTEEIETNTNETIKEQTASKETQKIISPSLKEQLIGIWYFENDKSYTQFTNDTFNVFSTEYNRLKSYSYELEDNKIIFNNTTRTVEIKDGKLYMGYGGADTILTKVNEIPNIIKNYGILNGTWNLVGDVRTITISEGITTDLQASMIINDSNTSGYKNCGGVGCKEYIVDYSDGVLLYHSRLCYKLIDNNTLEQKPCPSSNMIGYPSDDNINTHNITYIKTN